MRTTTILTAGLTGTVLLLAAAPAQEQKPGGKAVPARAIRLTAGGQQAPVSQEELTRRFDEKMKGTWLANARWITDYDEARKAAKAAGKPIVTYFTRSYSP